MKVTRKEFLFALGATAGAAVRAERLPARGPKALIVVAHPDDEYAFAATVYRIARELGGIVDQVVITNGEAGYRYSQLAEQVYRANLSDEKVGRALLPDIRRRETLAAGRILGIREHRFLDQRDTRFTLDCDEPMSVWDTTTVIDELRGRMEREEYDFVLTLLPSEDTHGHHKAATLLALRAALLARLAKHPVVLGADPARSSDPYRPYTGLRGDPATAPLPGNPVLVFDRTAHFGFHDALDYRIVVNWVIAEHKSQGLFQTDCNKHEEERFWVFTQNPPDAPTRTRELFQQLRPGPANTAALGRP